LFKKLFKRSFRRYTLILIIAKGVSRYNTIVDIID